MRNKNHVYVKNALLLLALLLTGCDNAVPVISDGTLRTQTPASLRAIPVEQLRADVLVSGVKKSYFGTDFPDGEWIVDLDVEANRRYVLLISWYQEEHLLMEETGNILPVTETPVIRPDLEVATFGPDRFDTDCDGVPNIVEIREGADPADGSDPNAASAGRSCPTAPLIDNPDNLELSWLNRSFVSYANSGVVDRVTKVEQPVFIVDTASEQRQFYSLKALSTGDIVQADGSLARAEATIRLDYDPAGPDFVRFFTKQAIGADPANGNGSSCTASVGDYNCLIPLTLSAGTSYTLALTEVSPFHWQATVTDEDAGLTSIVGVIETPSQTRWSNHVVDLGFIQLRTRSACAQGSEKISVRFSDGTVNDTVPVSPRVIDAVNGGPFDSGDCVKLGMLASDTAWTSGEKLINEATRYSLTIGD